LPPNYKKNVALTGFMAAGKSVVGKRLARRLKRRFVDLDQAIEAKAGMAVAAIFRRKGEKYFRALEKQLLREVLEKDGQVIATGGGAILDEDNLRLLKEKALIVCLTAGPETLLTRLGVGKERPLLEGEDRRQRIEELLKLREESYARAHLRIKTDDLTVEEVVEKILEATGIRQ